MKIKFLEGAQGFPYGYEAGKPRVSFAKDEVIGTDPANGGYSAEFIALMAGKGHAEYVTEEAPKAETPKADVPPPAPAATEPAPAAPPVAKGVFQDREAKKGAGK